MFLTSDLRIFFKENKSVDFKYILNILFKKFWFEHRRRSNLGQINKKILY